MAESLAAIERRIASVKQLSSVVTAMRGIAAARSAEAQARLSGIADYAATVGQAISRALALLGEPAPAHAAGGSTLAIAICAEQGFVGAFNHRVIDRVAAVLGTGDPLFLIGSRGLSLADEQGLAIGWSAPMAGHAGQIDALANRLADALFARIGKGEIGRIVLIHAAMADGSQAVDTVERTLVPFDFARFPPLHSSTPPITQIPLADLLQSLSEEYVFAELCEALTLSFAAENAERMRAMIAANGHVADTLEELTGKARISRQAEITEEVIELASGTMR